MRALVLFFACAAVLAAGEVSTESALVLAERQLNALARPLAETDAVAEIAREAGWQTIPAPTPGSAADSRKAELDARLSREGLTMSLRSDYRRLFQRMKRAARTL